MAVAEIPDATIGTPATSAPSSGGGDQEIALRHSVAVSRDADQGAPGAVRVRVGPTRSRSCSKPTGAARLSAPRPKCRHVGVSETPRRGLEERPMECTDQHDAIRKRRSSTRTPPQVRGPRADLCDEVRREARGCPFRALRAFEATLQVVLELFAGSCRWSRCVGQLGYYVLSIDMRFGVTNDLCKRGLQNLVLGWVQAGKIAFVLAAFPCQSFSKARNRPGGRPALRDSVHLTGLPGLRPCDQRKVLRGNECLYFCCRLAWACILRLVPLILENPWIDRPGCLTNRASL